MKTCSEPNCDRPHLARGLCSSHYHSARNSGKISRKISININEKCSVDGCEKDAKSKGMCISHYGKVKKYGDPFASATKKTGGPCSADGCIKPVVASGLCRTHYARLRRHGDHNAFSDWYMKREQKIIDAQGYALIYKPDHPNAKRGGRILEHRYVISVILGRALKKNENVHHMNGDKLDNRPENLELWETSQPSGQRVQDKAAWCIDYLIEHMEDAKRLDPSFSDKISALAKALDK